MALPIHNRTASILSLARTVRDGIDSARPSTVVQTETLKLLLDTLIELGSPAHHNAAAETARRGVEAMIAPPILDGRTHAG